MTTEIKKDDLPPFGSKMSVLSEKRRALVCALFDDDAPLHGDGLLVYAARKACYGNAEGTSTNAALGVIANRIVHDKAVQAAIAEYSHSAIRAISPEAIRAVRAAIRDPSHRDHIRAAAMILDRTEPIEQKHVVTIEDNTPPAAEAIDRVLARIDRLAASAGIKALPPPIDADYKVVSE